MIDLNHIVIRYRLGLFDTEALIHIADKLLEEGRHTPSVVKLSILVLESPIMAEAAPLFEKACVELGVAIPSQQEAINKLLHFQIESIASGAIAPQEGLEAMMRELYFPFIIAEPCKKYVGDSHGMEHLIGAYWNYDDLVGHPNEVSWEGKYGAEAIACWEEFVRQKARGWLQIHSPLSKH